MCLKAEDDNGIAALPTGCACCGPAGHAHPSCMIAAARITTDAAARVPHITFIPWQVCLTCKQRYTGPLAGVVQEPLIIAHEARSAMAGSESEPGGSILLAAEPEIEACCSAWSWADLPYALLQYIMIQLDGHSLLAASKVRSTFSALLPPADACGPRGCAYRITMRLTRHHNVMSSRARGGDQSARAL